MNVHEPTKLSAATLLVPRQREYALIPMPRRIVTSEGRTWAVRNVLGVATRRAGRHRAEPMSAPTWRQALRALVSSEQESTARPGRHACPPGTGGFQRRRGPTSRTTT